MVENEIQYIPWGQFRQMVPSILGLEVARLSKCIDHEGPGSEARNQLVRVRFDLRRFIECVADADRDAVADCESHLSSALLNVMPLEHSPDLAYVIDRLTYVRSRIPFVY